METPAASSKLLAPSAGALGGRAMTATRGLLSSSIASGKKSSNYHDMGAHAHNAGKSDRGLLPRMSHWTLMARRRIPHGPMLQPTWSATAHGTPTDRCSGTLLASGQGGAVSGLATVATQTLLVPARLRLEVPSPSLVTAVEADPPRGWFGRVLCWRTLGWDHGCAIGAHHCGLPMSMLLMLQQARVLPISGSTKCHPISLPCFTTSRRDLETWGLTSS